MSLTINKLETKESSRWQILLATWLGLMFDGFDATIFVLVLFPALSELLNTNSHATVGAYGGITMFAFMSGWAIGAILFGNLADRIGRTKSMIISILVYAVFTAICFTCHSWQELAFYRFLVGCGIGGEHSTGIVLIAESWRGKARMHATGIMITSFGVGYLLAGLLNIFVGPLGWRYLFLAGVVPALLTLYIRTKIKEPLQFQLIQEYKKRLQSGSEPEKIKHLHPSFRSVLKELFNKEHRQKVVVTSLLSSTAIVGYWAVTAWIPPWINQLTGTLAVSERSMATLVMNIGCIISGLTTSFLIIALGYRNTLRLSFLSALASCITMFLTVKSFGTALLVWSFVVGYTTIVPFICVFIYAPELFDARFRGTAIGFSVQTGRLMGGIFALIGGQLVALFSGSYALAASCIALFYLVGVAASFFMPATSGEVTLDSEFLDSLEKQKEPALVG